MKTARPGYKLIPPDGGYGWVVCAGSVLAGIMIAIPLTAFGLILRDLMAEMNSTTTEASWIPSLCVSMSMLSAPFNSMLINAYSARVSGMLGGFICSLGMILSYFVYRVEILYITYGIFVGAGLGMVTNSGFIALSQYFRSRYGLATGITIASFAVGRLIFSPIIQLMLDESIDFRGILLISGGLTLNACVGAALYQPGEWHLIEVPIEDEAIDNASGNKDTGHVTSSPVTSKPNGNNRSDIIDDTELARRLLGGHVNGNGGVMTSSADIFKLANSCDAQYSSVDNIAALVASTTVAPLPTTTEGDEIDLSSDVEEAGAGVVKVASSDPFACLAKGPFKTLNFRLLATPILYLLLASGLVGFIAAVYVSVFLPPLGIENGILPMEVATVASVRAGAEVAGRVLAPYVLERFHLHLNIFYIGLLAAHGVFLIIMIFMTSLASMLTISIIAGIIFGGVTGLSMINIVDCVGVGELASALSITQFLQSFLSLGVGPLIGFLRDATGSYALCFYFLAGTQFLCCVIWAFKPLALKKSNLNFI